MADELNLSTNPSGETPMNGVAPEGSIEWTNRNGRGKSYQNDELRDDNYLFDGGHVDMTSEEIVEIIDLKSPENVNWEVTDEESTTRFDDTQTCTFFVN